MSTSDELLTKLKQQARERSKKYYLSHKKAISEKRKATANKDKVIEKVVEVEVPIINQTEKEIIKQLQHDVKVINAKLQNMENNTKSDEIQQTKNYKFDLNETLELLNEHIENENSRRMYIHNIKTVFDIIRTGKDDVNTITLQSKLKNAKNVIYRLKTVEQSKKAEPYSTNSIKGFLQVILKLIDIYGKGLHLSVAAKKLYKDEFEKFKLQSNIESENKLTTETVMNFNDYLETIKEKYGEESKEYLIINFYKIAGFRDDISFFVVKEKPKVMDDKINYLIVPKLKTKNTQILLNQYKTVKKYGSKIIDVGKDDSKLIRNYIDNNEIEYNSYLFKTQSLSKTISNLNKKIGLNITINTIRHMLVSTALMDDDKVKDLNARLALSNTMNHSIATSTRTYKNNVVTKK